MKWLVVGVLLVAVSARADLTPEVVKQLEAAFERAAHEIGAGAYADARRDLDAARALGGGDIRVVATAAFMQATLEAYRGDWHAAAQVLLDFLPEAARHRELQAEFMVHNSLMMLRELEGDVPAALAECAAMTEAGRHGAWGDKAERDALIDLKDSWHQAYLLRMLAERRSGKERAATLAGAEAARQRYARIAPRENADSVAVLEGYFATLDGRGAAALAAARRVDVASDGDLEDLYLTALAYEAGGDKDRARRLREAIQASDHIYIAAPIMREFIARDAAGGKRVSPRFPRGKP